MFIKKAVRLTVWVSPERFHQHNNYTTAAFSNSSTMA